MTTTSEALFTLDKAVKQILTVVSETIPVNSLEVAFTDPCAYLYAAQKDDKVSLARAFASLSFSNDWRESACRRDGRSIAMYKNHLASELEKHYGEVIDRWPVPTTGAAFEIMDPKDGVYANAVIWSVLAGLCYSGWQDSGAVKPNTSALVPSGKFGLPIIVGLVNWLFYALPLTFMADKFVKEGFGREELMAGFTQPVNFMLSWLFFNIGLVCLFTAVLQLSLATVDAKDETIAYRVLRSSSLIWMYSNGSWSKDAVVNHLTGFEDPMRLFQFFTNFGLAMWSINTWAKAPVSLK